MSVRDRFGGIESKRLRHAFATQEIEDNPMTPDEIRMFRKMEEKGWSAERQTKFLLRNITREQRERGSRAEQRQPGRVERERR
jgi:translation elongation factor EF-Tu-like GTPase